MNTRVPFRTSYPRRRRLASAQCEGRRKREREGREAVWRRGGSVELSGTWKKRENKIKRWAALGLRSKNFRVIFFNIYMVQGGLGPRDFQKCRPTSRTIPCGMRETGTRTRLKVRLMCFYRVGRVSFCGSCTPLLTSLI
jgi:hypothetical protein